MYGQDEEKPKPIGLWIGLGAGFVALLVAAFFLFARAPERTPAPTAFVPFEAPDKAFVGQGPKDWERKRSASMGLASGVRFYRGTAKIEITADLQGSLMSDIAKAGDAQMANLAGALPDGMAAQITSQTKPPVERLHEAAGKALAKTLDDFSEQPMQTIQSALGEGRYSEFTGARQGALSGGKQHGYRVTILGGERQVSVLCQCVEDDWATLKPAFEKVINSLAPGQQN